MNNKFILLFLISIGSSSQDTVVTSIADAKIFEEFEKPFTAELIHYWPASPCGVMATASYSIVLLKNNDTAKVISLCEISKNFNTKDTITIYPAKFPTFQIDIVGDMSKESNLWITKNFKMYFGTIKLKE